MRRSFNKVQILRKHQKLDDMKFNINWSLEEDGLLKTLVQTYGNNNWAVISNEMNLAFPKAKKVSNEYKERWYEKYPLPTIREEWTEEEEALLILEHMKHKNHWTEIVKSVKGKTNNMVKNRFYAIFRRICNKIKAGNFSFESKIEVIKTYYTISIMEEYLNNPLLVKDPRRKRGKDYICTLVGKISQCQLTVYKEKLLMKHPIDLPLDKSLTDMICSYPSGSMRISESLSFCDSLFIVDSSAKKKKPIVLPLPKSLAPTELLSKEEKELFRHDVFINCNSTFQSTLH